MSLNFFLENLNFLFHVGENNFFPQKLEISNVQAIANFFRYNLKKIFYSKIFFLNSILKYSFNLGGKAELCTDLFSIIDADFFFLHEKEKNLTFLNFKKFFKLNKDNHLAFFLNNLICSKATSLIILPRFIFHCSITLEKNRNYFVFQSNLMKICLSVLTNSFFFFFDQSPLEHSLSIIKGFNDFSLDLNGVKGKTFKNFGGSQFQIDKLSNLYKIAFFRLKQHKKCIKESRGREIFYYRRAFRFKFSLMESKKKTKIYKPANLNYFLDFKSNQGNFKNFLKFKKKEIEKFFLESFLILLNKISKYKGCWIISKLIQILHNPFLRKNPHLLNHMVLSSFSQSFIAGKNSGIFICFFLANYLGNLGIEKFPLCLKCFLVKNFKKAKGSNLKIFYLSSDLSSFFLSTLNLKTSWDFLLFFSTSSQFFFFLNNSLQKIFLLSNTELVKKKIFQRVSLKKKT